MKKLLFAFPIVALLAAGCNSSQQASGSTPVQAPVVQKTLPTQPGPMPTSPATSTPNPELTINSVSGPTTLVVGQTGTWTINASDSVNSNLSYGAIFGDEGIGCGGPPGTDCSKLLLKFATSQSPTISHSYQRSLNYTVNFIVKDDKGNYATKSIPINIKTSATSAINITSPIGGETWRIGETHNITWTSTDVKDVYITLAYYNSNGAQEASEPITPIGGVPASQGSYSWTIQNQMYPNGTSILNPSGQTFKISINEVDGTAQATSGFFNMVQ